MSNLSEEEKKAIEGIRKDIKEARTIERVVGKESVKNIRQYEIALNLIEKLQNELYEEKEKNKKWEKVIQSKIKKYKNKKSIINGVIFENNTKVLEEILQEMHEEEKDLEIY